MCGSHAADKPASLQVAMDAFLVFPPLFITGMDPQGPFYTLRGPCFAFDCIALGVLWVCVREGVTLLCALLLDLQHFCDIFVSFLLRFPGGWGPHSGCSEIPTPPISHSQFFCCFTATFHFPFAPLSLHFALHTTGHTRLFSPPPPQGGGASFGP